jgi:hypothetical protein
LEDESVNKYTARFYDVSQWGLLTKADEYIDVDFDSDKPLDEFCQELLKNGFIDPSRGRWWSPSALIWVEERD